jgi:hypothetical protein
MCHECSGTNYDRPITIQDREILKKHYASIDTNIVDGLYDRITDKNYPQPAVLVMILEMIYRDQNNDNGLYPVPLSPFSAMDLDTGERVQTPEMYAFHTVFESFALAQRNFSLMNQYLEKVFKKKIELFCDCGCDYRPTEPNKELDTMINDINAFRSFYESIGTKVIKPTWFEDSEWTKRTLDMWTSEIQSYKRMYSILTSLDHIDIQEPNDIYLTRQMLKNIRQKQVSFA